MTTDALREDRWFALLVMTRLVGAAGAVTLLLAHTVTHADGQLAAVTAGWAAITLIVFGSSVRARRSAWAWAADTLAAFALVLLSGDWRSPFYVYALTTLVLPATALGARGAVAWGGAFAGGYALTAVLTHKVPADTIGNTIRLETLATHLLVPLVIAIALAYSGSLLRRLNDERGRSERLAVEAERQRIAWELHDSAKQRVHAAHLLLSSVTGAAAVPAITQTLTELRGAAADMETSIAELRAPIDGRPIGDLVRLRAGELAAAGELALEIRGDLPPLAPLVGAHVYRIVSEALTNAARHAHGSAVRVDLSTVEGGRIVVEDDGPGLDPDGGPPGQGLRSMRARAETIGARLDIGPGGDGTGTRIDLTIPRPAHQEIAP